MDPVSLEHLLSELSSTRAETVSIPVEKLTPGCVIATGSWERHIVTELPTRLNQHTGTMVVPLRHLHGGHTLRPYFPGESQVTIYRARMGRPTAFQVPVVPRCVVPDAPEVGDRVVMQWYNAHSLGIGDAQEFNGEHWQQVSLSTQGRTQISQYATASVQAFVQTSNNPSWGGWHVYLPAGHRPHLYADGRPVPARTAEGLAEGDVVLIPGGGRLQVEGIARHADGCTLRLHVLAPSRHLMRHLTWASKAGDRIEHHDSGRLGYLYATEPRAEELVSAADLHVGDTVIAAWGTPYSNVATVDEVWRQGSGVMHSPLTTMHVHSTMADGRHVRTQTGFNNRYYVLHRAARAALAQTA